MSATFALLVPVKPLSLAKSRLGPRASTGRERLMRAFAHDAIDAALQSRLVGHVYVVTDEPGFDADGVRRLPDAGAGDLNRALLHAWLRVRLEHPSLAVAAMCADLPCLTSHDLDAALAAGLSPRWFVADSHGTGTTLLAAAPGTDLDPHFGAGSALRHEESGAVAVRADVTGLRLDVDTEHDLRDATRVGVGPHTRAALEDLDSHV